MKIRHMISKPNYQTIILVKLCFEEIEHPKRHEIRKLPALRPNPNLIYKASYSLNKRI
jgi:hypothetical protein